MNLHQYACVVCTKLVLVSTSTKCTSTLLLLILFVVIIYFFCVVSEQPIAGAIPLQRYQKCVLIVKYIV